MPNLTYPGVYVTEAEAGAGPITGVSTSNLGLLGYTPEGPVDEPTLCTTFGEFVAAFGTFTADGLAAHMAYAFFANGGQRLYMVRVTHDDAVAASWDLNAAVLGEDLGNDVEPTGKYVLQLAHPPVRATVPGSVTIAFGGALGDTFTDNGLGVLAKTAGAGAGGAGTIDYVTGEVTIQLNDPADFTGGAGHILAAYGYRVFRFTMAWPGLAGNKFRLLLTPGDDDFLVAAQARWTRFTVTLERDISTDPTAQLWSQLEQFTNLVFDDATDPNFVATVLNDSILGSSYITVTAYGNEVNPAALQGTAVVNEDLSATQTPAYDGVTKAFAFTLASPPFPGTLALEFRFNESLLTVGMGDGTGAPACAALGCPIQPGGGTVALARVTVRLTRTIGGATVLYDDGAGNLRTAPFPGAVEGTIAYTTGQVTLALTGGDTAVIGVPVTISCEYVHPVTVVDDGDGGLAIATPAVGVLPPTKFQLNSAGPNTVTYATGAVALAWQLAGSPAAGPAGVGGPTSATKVGAAGTYSLTPGAAFTLNVDGAGALAVTFNAAAGYVQDTTAYPVADQDAKTILLTIDGVAQTVLFSGVTTALADVVSQINAQIAGGYATTSAGHLRIVSDSKGTGSAVAITGGTHGLTFAAPTAGTGNVVNIQAVTPGEVETIIEAATAAEVTLVPAGAFTISSPTQGAASTLVFAGTAAVAALGLSDETITGLAGANGETADYYTDPADSVTGALTGGLDGSATDSNDLVGAALAADSRGLYAFGKVDELMTLVAADFQTDPIVLDAMITYAQLMGDKFVLGAVPHGLAYARAATWRRTLVNRNVKECAIYYPHIKVADPVSESVVDLPPCGHLAGIYARTDAAANVSTAAAGTERGSIGWAVGLEYDLTPAQVGSLKDAKINALIQWPATGRVVWGARTLDVAGGIWPFVPQVRLFQFVKKSVFLATHHFVFRSNGPALWAQVRAAVETFLQGLFTAGYMPSAATASEAYFVVCDASINDADTNVVNCQVGIRVPQTTEYVVFTFSQMTV